MSRDSNLGAHLYEAESSWGENVTTYTNRLATIGPVDVSGLEQARVDANRTVQRLGDYTMPIRSVMGGSFKTRFYLPGHGSTTAGAITAEEHETVLGYAIGNLISTGTGTTCTGGSTGTIIATSASANFTAGGIVFAGSLSDGRGGGQAGAVGTHVGNVLTLLNELPGAPGAADVLASSFVAYPTETAASAAVTSTRWRLLTANHCYECHGCFPVAISLDGTNPGEVPTVEITWAVSWFADVAPTFPSTVSVDTFTPAPNAGGSLFVQSVGTTSRQWYTCRSFRLNVELGIEPLMGPGGVNAFQHIVGAVRKQHTAAVEFTVDAGNSSTTPTWATRWDSDSQFYHLLYTFSGAATGKRLALYLPNACMVGARQVQRNDGGINRETVTFRGATGTTTTSELTMSSYRIALG